MVNSLPNVPGFTFCRVRAVSPRFCPVRALSLCQVSTSCAKRCEVPDKMHKQPRAVTNNIDRKEWESPLEFIGAECSLPYGNRKNRRVCRERPEICSIGRARCSGDNRRTLQRLDLHRQKLCVVDGR